MMTKYIVGIVGLKSEIKANHPDLPKVVRRGRGTVWPNHYTASGFLARLHHPKHGFELREVQQ